MHKQFGDDCARLSLSAEQGLAQSPEYQDILPLRPPLAAEQQRQPGVMMIRGILTAGAVAAGVFTSAAQADIVYTWQQTSASPTIVNSTGRIVFADGALPGPISYTYNGQDGSGFNPSAPFRTFNFSVSLTGAPAQSFLTFAGDTSTARNGQSVSLSGVEALGTGLIGRIFGGVASTDAAFALQSDSSGLWTISDAYPGDVFRGSGATGRWAFAGFVPVPGVLPLLALGAFGLAATMQRRKSH